ncbi:hypothetical protein ACS0TY_006228 [Phlomoides rotata]
MIAVLRWSESGDCVSRRDTFFLGSSFAILGVESPFTIPCFWVRRACTDLRCPESNKIHSRACTYTTAIVISTVFVTLARNGLRQSFHGRKFEHALKHGHTNGLFLVTIGWFVDSVRKECIGDNGISNNDLKRLDQNSVLRILVFLLVQAPSSLKGRLTDKQ